MLNKKELLLILALYFLSLSSVLCGQEQAIPLGKTDFIYNSKGRRNPFTPLVTSDGRIIKLQTEDTGTGLLVEGIIYDSRGLSYTIVNGSVVKVGDLVAGYQVLKIEKDKVIFIKEGQTREVQIKKEEE
jgi:hypothetical protein